MAVCESQLESGLARLNREASDDTSQERTLPAGLPLTVDYRSPVSHFVPPAVELYARHKQDQNVSSAESSETTTPVKRKRGRPRVDKTSPEYLANLAARKQAREMAAMSRGAADTPPGEKRKRGRPRVDKTSPEYLARKRERELEALERKAKKEYKRRNAGATIVTKTIPSHNNRQQNLTNNRNVANNSTNNRNLANNSTNNRNVPNNSANTRSVAHNSTNSRNNNSTNVRNVANNPTNIRNVAKNSINNRNVANNSTNSRNSPRTAANDKNLPNRPVANNKTVPNNKNVANNRRPPARASKRLPSAKSKVAARKLPQKSGKVAPPRKIAAKNVVVRRNSKFSKVKRKDSGASSSTGDTTPRVKRKYTKRTPSQKKNDGTPGVERVKGKRGRPRKNDPMNVNRHQQPKIRVRSNLMPMNNEPISLDSDDEPDLGSPGAASDSLSLDENLRALRHLHEKYANIDKDEMFESHLLAANFKKPGMDGQRRDDDDVLSIRSSEGGNSVKEMDRVEKLEDSSGSDSDSSSSGSGSSSSGSSSSSSCSSSSSDSSDSETETNHVDQNSTYSAPAWAAPAFEPPGSDSASDSDPERSRDAPAPGAGSHDEISESDNESPDKSFQCHICKKWYSTKVTLKIHRRSHQSRGGTAPRARQRSSDRYECDICSETFPRREKLYAHKADAHRGAMTFRCEVCRRCFEHDDELAAHRDQHTDDEKNGRCSECGSVFPRWEQLRRHRAAAHPALPPAACEGGALPHACAHCGKRFSNVHSLTRHLHNHAKQLYRCVVCKASFAKAEQLAQHLNSHLANYKRLKP